MLRFFHAYLKKELCPFCFETFKLRTTPFRCSSPPQVCKPEIDEIRKDIWKQSIPMGRAIQSNRYRKRVKCDSCGHHTQKRLCPKCHMELPHSIGDVKTYIFSIIGAKEAGKSHYIATLVDHFRSNVGLELDLLMEPLNADTMKRYKDRFYDRAYIQRKTIEPTVPYTGVPPLPLVYGLTITDKRPFRYQKKVVTLVFFDTAGEDLDDEDILSIVNKYIYFSDGIILLLDPLQLGHVRNSLASDTPLPAVNTEIHNILTSVARLIRVGMGLTANAIIRTPIAVAFSKFDAVKPLVDQDSQLNGAADHSDGYDLEDFQAVDGDVQALLADWKAQILIHQVQTHFKHYGFFGVSALGCNPHSTNRIPHIIPQRVEDPFLWLLFEHRLLKQRRIR